MKRVGRCSTRRVKGRVLLVIIVGMAVASMNSRVLAQGELVTLNGIARFMEPLGSCDRVFGSVDALSGDGQEVYGRAFFDSSGAGATKLGHDGRKILAGGESIPGISQATFASALSVEAVVGGAAWSLVRTTPASGGSSGEAILQGKRSVVAEGDVVPIGLGGVAPATVLFIDDFGGCNAREAACELNVDTVGNGLVTESIAVKITTDGQGGLIVVERVAGTGDLLPGLPAPVAFVRDVSLASNSNYGFLAVDELGNTAVYLNGALIAASGTPSPIPGLSYRVFNGVSVNAAGEVAFVGQLSDNRQFAVVDDEVVVDGLNPHPLILADPAVTQAAWVLLARPVLDDRGRLFVQATPAVAPQTPPVPHVLIDGVPFVIPNASELEGEVCLGGNSTQRTWVDSAGTALQLGYGILNAQGQPESAWALVLPAQSSEVCSGGVNSNSMRASISVHGPVHHTSTKALLVGKDLPPNTFAVLLAGSSGTTSVSLPGSSGLLCVNGPVIRGIVVRSTPESRVRLNLTPNLFEPTGTAPAAGSTWTFQLWYRDPSAAAGILSGLSGAVSVLFD